MALRLEHDRQLRQAEARSAVVFGDRQPVPPQPRRRLPDLRGMGRAAVEGRSCGPAGFEPAQLPNRGFCEVAVFVGDRQG